MIEQVSKLKLKNSKMCKLSLMLTILRNWGTCHDDNFSPYSYAITR